MSYSLPDTPDNNIFTSETLQKIIIRSSKFKDLTIFPQKIQIIGGMPIFQSITLKETLFSPVVSGILTVNDIGNFIENYNIEGFEDIEFTFKKVITGTSIVFHGIITDVTLLSNDSVLAIKMNADEYIRLYSLTFMNKDLFIANYMTVHDPDNKNQNIPKDWVGWISRK